MADLKREATAASQIITPIHCPSCMSTRPAGVTATQWALLDVGFTERGLQIWCRRHDVNVAHVDFEGHRHPVERVHLDRPRGGAEPPA